jgi:hypothetical protein
LTPLSGLLAGVLWLVVLLVSIEQSHQSSCVRMCTVIHQHYVMAYLCVHIIHAYVIVYDAHCYRAAD